MASARPWLILLASGVVLGIGFPTFVKGELTDNLPFLMFVGVAGTGAVYGASVLRKRKGWSFHTSMHVANTVLIAVAGAIAFTIFTIRGEWPDGTVEEDEAPAVRLIESSSPIVDDAGAEPEAEAEPEPEPEPDTARAAATPETTRADGTHP